MSEGGESSESRGTGETGDGRDGGDGREIRVVVVDDQAVVRMGLRTLIETEDGMTLAGEADNGRTGVDLVRRLAPDVVLMDIRMPVLDGLAALREISDEPELSGTHVVMLTTFELDEYVFEALRGGAAGFILKDAEPADLLQAIRVVVDGGSLLSPTVTRRVIERFSAGGVQPTAPHPDVHRLTEREAELAGWVATGMSNDEIAAELVVSPATVRTHVSRAMVKLGARDRAQVVVFAVQSGLAH